MSKTLYHLYLLVLCKNGGKVGLEGVGGGVRSI